MTGINLLCKPLKLAFIVGLAALGFMPVRGQSVASEIWEQRQDLNSTTDLVLAQSSNSPRGQGTPSGTKPGGRRNPCPNIQKPLTPLVLTSQQSEGRELHWGYTTKEHSTIWVYVPYDSQSISSSKFSLRNREDEPIYETDLTLTGTPGIIRIPVPPTAPSLERGQWYQWYLFVNVYCTPTTPAQQDSIRGWVVREEPNAAMRAQLEKATPQQQAILYAKDSFLYDALTTLAEVKNTNPSDDNWGKLLRDSGLEAIASEQMVNCCTLQSQ
jgi:hypothetical protein